MQHYFQCSDCAKHFMEMASEKAALAVTTRQDAVLWSWRAHNEAPLSTPDIHPLCRRFSERTAGS